MGALEASRDTETGQDRRPPGRRPFWELWRVRGLWDSLEDTGEEPAPEDAGEEPALEGALTAQRLGGALAAQRLGGALAAQRLGGALAAQRLGGALAARSWTGPAGRTEMSWAGPEEMKMSWFRLGTGNFPDTGKYPLSNTIPWCLGDPWGDGKRPRAETGGGWPRRASPSLRQARRIPRRTPRRRDSAG